MKKILEELKGARRIEWFLAVAAVAILLLTQCAGSDSAARYRTDEESRLISVLQKIDGVGRVDVMISADALGVLVVADGADQLAVCLRIQYVVQTLLGCEASDVEIVPYMN